LRMRVNHQGFRHVEQGNATECPLKDPQGL
jgi:hypothetical protein